MKQTARRILSLVLSFVMLVSMMTVFTFAANNYVPDEQYYRDIHETSYIVIPDIESKISGNKITYEFRGQTYTEDYDPTVHYPTLQAAFDAYVENKVKSPVIAVATGVCSDGLVITDSVTIIGSNGGINPVVKGATEQDVWKENNNRFTESCLKGVILVDRTVKSDVEVKLDGVTLLKGFSFIETGMRENKSTVYCENTIINNAGGGSLDSYSASDVFSFASATKTENALEIKNTLIKNMAASNVTGVGVTTFNAEGVLFTTSQGALLGGADAPANQEPNYTVTNCMFYNNKSTLGVISLDHSVNDNATRTISSVKVSKCWFIDGPDTPVTDAAKKVSPIYITVVGSKNELDVTDCYFEGKNCKTVNEEEIKETAPVVSVLLTAGAKNAELKNKVRVNNNVCVGYPCLPDTTGMSPTSTVDFTGNFFANSAFTQIDPVYPSVSSYQNVYMDYYYLNDLKTVKSTQFEIKSLGINGADIDHKQKIVDVTVGFDYKAPVSIQAKDPNTTFTLYDSTMTVVTEIDASKLVSGVKKNVFYAVSSSKNYPSYSNKYKIYISTFDPLKALDFSIADHYMLTEEVEGLANGSIYYTSWDGVSYKFTVGKNVFATLEEIYAVCGDKVPTVIIPAGTYSKTLYVTRSTVLLGAKYGINPNIPDFENPDIEWRINDERANSDQETVLNCVIAYEPENSSSFVTVDGFTFGRDSGFADTTKKENTYTNSSIENCIADGAGGGKYETNNATANLSAIFNVGSAASDVSTAYKTFHLKNFRMVGQLTTIPLGSYFNRLIMDGCYIANNTHNQLFTNEITAPKGQDFYFELRNSCFYKNATTTYYFVINHNATPSAERKKNLVVFDNNTFYETNSNANGIFGIRWQGSRDHHVFTNNNFISSTATAFIPGYENWFIGNSGYKAAAAGTVDPSTLEPLKRENHIIKNNRFIGKVINSTPNMIYTHDDTVMDFSENYFASSFGKSVEGTVLKMTTVNKTFCNSYYKDYAMTEMVTPSDEFNTALDYEFYNADKTAKTFKAVASDTARTYEFDYELNTPQASMKVYTDAACTNQVENPVTLAGGDNVFYVVFSSYDGTVKDVYTATVTKKASTGASINQFGNWKIQGNSIFGCVPFGATTFNVPEIVASVGATYKMYNDFACTSEFTDSKITVNSNVPAQKFIKVVSQDGATTNVYTLTVVQAENDQAELVAVANGTRTSQNLFTASTDSFEYIFDPAGNISTGATVKVFDGAEEIKANDNGTFTVESVVTEKTVKVTVTSANGKNSNDFSIRIIKGIDSTDIKRIHNMYTNSTDGTEFFGYVAEPIFIVNAVLASDGATYAVYSDRNCTVPVKDNCVVPSTHDTVVYLKVTSANGLNTKVYKLNIESALIAPEEILLDEVYEIQGATLEEGTSDSYTAVVPEGTTKFTINLVAKEESYNATTFAVFADPAKSMRISSESPIGTPVEVELTGRNTRVYLRVYVKKGEAATGIRTDNPVVNIVTPQPKATYKDQSSIANWAADEIAFLNDNGYGYFVGDSNGNFNPTASISRFEVAVVVAKILGVNTTYYATKRNPFYDNVPKWAHPYVVAVNEFGIMAGKDGNTFAGSDPTTRQEFARIISGTLAILNREEGTIDDIYTTKQALIDYDYSQYTFADEADVSKWARTSIKLAVSHYKVMSGSKEGDKLFLNPKKPITRQEVAVLVANLSGYTAK